MNLQPTLTLSKSLLITLYLCIVQSINCFGQYDAPDSLSKKEARKWEKSHNIVDLSDQLSLKLYIVNKSNKITHHDGQTRNEVEYQPNGKVNIGFGVNYKWLGFDAAFDLPSINNDDDLYGTTKSLDLQADIFLHKYVFDASFFRYEGYYNNNPNLYIPDFDSSDSGYPTRPDIKTGNFSFSGLYIFNHTKFSFRHAFTFNEIQRRSAGSFLAGAFFNSYQISADSSLIPQALQSEFDLSKEFSNSELINFGVMGGYAYNLILLKHLYASASVALGLGPTFENLSTSDGSVKDVKSAPFGIIRLGAGFNDYKWFGGINLTVHSGGSEDNDDTYLERERNTVEVHLGFRIKPPKVLDRLL